MRALLLTSIALLAGPLHAQQIPGHQPPGEHECRVAINKLGSSPGSAAFYEALVWGRMAECGAAGERAIADALVRTRTYSDLELLGLLSGHALSIRSSTVFDAALRVAGERLATVEARAANLAIAAALYDGLHFPGTFAELTSVPQDPFCTRGGVTPSPFLVQHPLPADAGPRLLDLASRLEGDVTEPALLRSLGRCTALYLQLPAWGTE